MHTCPHCGGLLEINEAGSKATCIGQGDRPPCGHEQLAVGDRLVAAVTAGPATHPLPGIKTA